MSGKRQYWSKMNHAEVKAAAEMMSDEELGRWLRGWVHGATGSEGAVECERMEFRLGLSVGKVSHQDAEEFSRKQSKRVSKRYTGATAVDSVEEKLPDTTEATGEYHLSLPDLPINKQTNKQTKNKEQQGARQAAFVPPSENEWTEHFRQRWPAMPRNRVELAFASYESKGWMRETSKGKSVSIVNWRGVAQTAFLRWKEWNPQEFSAANREHETRSKSQAGGPFAERGPFSE